MSIKGYKVFNSDWTCRGFQYEVGKTYKHNEDIEVCERGFHFCQKASACFNYYIFDPTNKVAEVNAIGLVKTCGDKSVTDEIVIVREISWQELLTLVNTGDECTGLCNSGNHNSGNHNSGNENSGNWNSGHNNSGIRNSGSWNSGTRNSGFRNSGDCNSGGHNSRHWNSGSYNSGNENSGDWNSGDWNSGDHNSGDWNSGDWNSGDHNSGFFNTKTPNVIAFNKPTNMTYEEFLSSKGIFVLNQNYKNNLWVCSNDMTDEEKEAYPEHETTGGYLKTVDFKTACKMMWNKLNDEEKQAVKEIPNFDADVFEEITGIDVTT